MKITIEQYGNKYSVERKEDDLDIDEVKDILKGLLVSAGFHIDNVKEIFKEE